MSSVSISRLPVSEVDLVLLHLASWPDEAPQQHEGEDVEGKRPGVVQRVDDRLHHVRIRLHLWGRGGCCLMVSRP